MTSDCEKIYISLVQNSSWVFQISPDRCQARESNGAINPGSNSLTGCNRDYQYVRFGSWDCLMACICFSLLHIMSFPQKQSKAFGRDQFVQRHAISICLFPCNIYLGLSLFKNISCFSYVLSEINVMYANLEEVCLQQQIMHY